ncbi:hypothetical protein [Mycobacterium aquaticum]|uniref:Uncharacterized protein n=1 Tax=Mycobacterium aquaticum TaxID=1927124 RepID=A0A1X0B402_9MYCO|nr:hypothetical protein [Mycobacterium aquaticum]ORA36939.1 hypothetical protein BST13_09565 [Mycobacterium aquaticum]
MGIQSIFRPFWRKALHAFLFGVPGVAVALTLNRLAMEDSSVVHLAFSSLWLAWLPFIFTAALVIGLVSAWSKSRTATRYWHATPGLSDDERIAAAQAVSNGSVLAEPSVRAAGRTFAGWSLARNRRGPLVLSGIGVFWVLITLACAVVGHFYISYAVVGLVFLVLACREWHNRKRLEANWAALARNSGGIGVCDN